jgi:transcriptional regulator with XRE-family HTH domain
MGEFKGIGKALKALRIQAGMSQQELARRSGLTAPMISNYEHGKVVPQIPSLDSILQALGRDRFDLLEVLEEVNDRPPRDLRPLKPREPEATALERLGLTGLSAEEQRAYLEMLRGICRLLALRSRR